MSRLRTSPDERSDRALPAVRTPFRPSGASPPPTGAGHDGPARPRYPTSKVRPTSQLMARGGLLAAVAIGCLGGIVGLLRSPGDGGADVPSPTGDADVLPGSVAGVAERAVEAWLMAGQGDDAALEAVDALFVEPPATPGHGRDDEPLVVDEVTAVSGERLEDGYWTVIVAADIVDPPPPGTADRTDAQADEQAEAEAAALGGVPDPEAGDTGRSTFYVEIGIVGNDAGGLAALTTPGVLPGPVEIETGWRRDGPSTGEPDPDDPLTPMVGSFLNALLAGQGDPAPYLASGVDIPVASPPPFAEIVVDGMSIVELDDGSLRLWVEVTATTASGTPLPAAYEMVVEPRADRFDVLELWGSPTVTGSAEPPSADGSGAEDGADEPGDGPVNDGGPAGTEGSPATTAGTSASTTMAAEPGA